MWVTFPCFSARQPHLISSQQDVGDSTLSICQQVSGSSNLIPWPTESEWQCPLVYWQEFHPITNRKWAKSALSLARQSYHVSCHDQQRVSDGACYFSLFTSHTMHMTNRLWVRVLFSPQDPGILILSHLASEWQCPFVYQAASESHDKQHVSVLFGLLDHLIKWHPMTNSLWVPTVFVQGNLGIPHSTVCEHWTAPVFLQLYYLLSHD